MIPLIYIFKKPNKRLTYVKLHKIGAGDIFRELVSGRRHGGLWSPSLITMRLRIFVVRLVGLNVLAEVANGKEEK